jgi:two-component system response regulator HydG
MRERKGDIPLLAAHFLEKFSDVLPPVRAISEDALRRLMAYDWPGNIRELENAIECAVALSDYPVLTADDLTAVPDCACAGSLQDGDEFVPLAEVVRRAVLQALQEAGGNKIAAAHLLRIGKTTLYRKLKEYATAPQPTERQPRDKQRRERISEVNPAKA